MENVKTVFNLLKLSNEEKAIIATWFFLSCPEVPPTPARQSMIDDHKHLLLAYLNKMEDSQNAFLKYQQIKSLLSNQLNTLSSAFIGHMQSLSRYLGATPMLVELKDQMASCSNKGCE